MKTLWKMLIAGIVIIIIGVVVFVVALGLNGWSFAGTAKFETKTYTSGSGIDELDVTVNAGPSRTEFYDGDKIIIEYPENDRFKPQIKENGNQLKFSSGNVKWYNFSFGWNLQTIPETVIKLPKNTVFDLDMVLNAGTLHIADGTYKKVDITVNAGSLSIGDIVSDTFSGKVNAGSLRANGIKCGELDCKVNAGSLNLSFVTCPDIDAKVSAGSLSLKIDGVKSEYGISVDKSAGSCNVSGQTGTTDKTLEIKISAGSATIKFTTE